MGLINQVPHLVENSSDTSEPIHGFGWDRSGEPIENQLASVAMSACAFILGEQRLYTAEQDGVKALAPAWDTQSDIQMVGVYRLVYRPHTRLTADWWRRLQQSGEAWLEIYRTLGPLPSKPSFPVAAQAGWIEVDDNF